MGNHPSPFFLFWHLCVTLFHSGDDKFINKPRLVLLWFEQAEIQHFNTTKEQFLLCCVLVPHYPQNQICKFIWTGCLWKRGWEITAHRHEAAYTTAFPWVSKNGVSRVVEKGSGCFVAAVQLWGLGSYRLLTHFRNHLFLFAIHPTHKLLSVA